MWKTLLKGYAVCDRLKPVDANYRKHSVISCPVDDWDLTTGIDCMTDAILKGMII